jgi:hypothetical protein
MPRSRIRRALATYLPSKRRWTVDDARAVLDRLESSGKSVREFAEAEGLDPQRLHRWRAQIAKGAAPAFVEISRRSPAEPMEVVLRSGHVVRVSDGFSEETLRRVVAVLSEESDAC